MRCAGNSAASGVQNHAHIVAGKGEKMIDEKELLKKIKSVLPLDAVCTVEETIEEMPKIRWIPVSERLPENDKYILLSFENYSLPDIGRYEVDGEGGAFYLGDEEQSCISFGIFVNAWMPLPEIYREEE